MNKKIFSLLLIFCCALLNKSSAAESSKFSSKTVKLLGCMICRAQENLKKCSGCKVIYYCSRECQKKDWSSHKIICGPELKNKHFVIVDPQNQGPVSTFKSPE